MLCAALCLIGSMNDMTASSVSLEGKNLWLAQSLPVTAWQLLRAKLLVQLLVTGIPMAVTSVLVLLAIRPALQEAVLLVVLPLLFVWLSAEFAIPFQQTVVGALRYYSRESLPFRAAVSPRGKSPRVCSYRCTVVGDERERGAVGCLSLGERHSEGHWSVAPVACPSYPYALRVGVGARILEIANFGMGECCAEAEVAACQRFGVNIIHKALPVDDVSHPSVDGLKPYLVPVVCLDEVCLVGVFAQYRWSQPFPFLRRPISLVSAESGCWGCLLRIKMRA